MSIFESVINSRYQAPILSKIWSSHNKIKTMRQLWIDLASIQKELGIDCITDEAIKELINARDIIDLENIKYYEMRLKHDIMAHIRAYSEMCPLGGKIIHLGATSSFINDNVDAILIKSSFITIQYQLTGLCNELKFNSQKYSTIPTIAYTHLQSAQLITIGRRFSMWLNDLLLDNEHLKNLKIPFRGIKGAVGTEDTLLKLFNNDLKKCDSLNEKLAFNYNFSERIVVCGQTYSRKYDVEYIHILSSICQSIYKMMNDIRLLSGKMEVYEDFKEEQIGSSAMPYKKNPITCEKICSLCRLVINHEQNITQTYINQWLERSLDDSAIKRIIFPECFLLMEYILDESITVIEKLQFNIKYINQQVNNHMNNIVSEEIIIHGVKMGYNRQHIHERLRKILTGENSSFCNLSTDNIIENIINNNNISLDPKNYIGRSIEQCFIHKETD
jgi:adenylosuccinate lyase